MNILFLYRIYPSYGGVEVVTTVLANEFIKDGHRVTIASFEGGKEGLLEQLDKRVFLLHLNRSVLSLHNMRRMKCYCKVNNIDVIINQWGLPFYTSLFLKIAVPNIPLISELHGSPTVTKTLLTTKEKIFMSKTVFDKLKHRLVLFFKRCVIKYGLRYNLRVNDAYILLSPSFIPVLETFIGKHNNKILYAIGNPITVKTDYNNYSTEKTKTLLYVGRMDYANKRVDRVVDFWIRCHNRLPEWNMVLIGDGPYRQALEEKAKNLPRIEFKPFAVDPPIEFYKKASILLLTSDLEGFGLVVIEAMSYGVVPVVYGSYEAIYDIIDAGKNGIITGYPFNEEEFDNSVISLCNDNKQRELLANMAVEKSLVFSIDSIKTQWYTIINNIITI